MFKFLFINSFLSCKEIKHSGTTLVCPTDAVGIFACCKVIFLVHYSRWVARGEKLLALFVVKCSVTIFGRSRYMS